MKGSLDWLFQLIRETFPLALVTFIIGMLGLCITGAILMMLEGQFSEALSFVGNALIFAGFLYLISLIARE